MINRKVTALAPKLSETPQNEFGRFNAMSVSFQLEYENIGSFEKTSNSFPQAIIIYYFTVKFKMTFA